MVTWFYERPYFKSKWSTNVEIYLLNYDKDNHCFVEFVLKFRHCQIGQNIKYSNNVK